MWDELEKIKMGGMGESYPLIKAVAAGETTLEKEVERIEQDFYKAAFRWKKDKKKIESCMEDIQTIIKTYNEFSRKFHIPEQEDHTHYYYASSLAVKTYVLGGSILSIACGIGTIATVAITGGVCGLTLVTLAGQLSGLGFMEMPKILESCGLKTKDKKGWKKAVQREFKDMARAGISIDRDIHQTYIMDYYLRDAQEKRLVRYETVASALFKNTFKTLKPEAQELLIKRLLDSEEPNQSLDTWLSKEHPKLVNDVARERLYK